jgi:hypothetical protein
LTTIATHDRSIPSAIGSVYELCVFLQSGIRSPVLTQDLTVDRPSGQIWLFIRKAKGDKRRSAADKPILAIPTKANPTLADLLEWYCAQRAAYGEKFYNNPPPTALWSFAPYENSNDWQAAATLSAWLLDAYTAIGAAPPKRSSGHRAASAKVQPPLLAVLGPHFTSSNAWVAGPRTIM